MSENPHPDQTLPEDLAEQDPEGDIVAEEEEITAEEPPKLDNAAIRADAEARVVKMKEAGRADEDIARTYAGQVSMLFAQNDDAISAALHALATVRVSDKKVKEGPYNRRRLAVQVASGAFDAPQATQLPA
jgi:hypothetical protein